MIGQLRHGGSVGAPFAFIAVEQRITGPPLADGGQFPAEIGSIADAAVQPLPGKGRHDMRGIACQQNTPRPEAFGHTGMKGIDQTAFNMRGPRSANRLHQRAGIGFIRKAGLIIAGHQQKFPSPAVAADRQGHAGAARIAEKADLAMRIIIALHINDQPFFGKG